jgi:hypothetical protein
MNESRCGFLADTGCVKEMDAAPLLLFVCRRSIVVIFGLVATLFEFEL